MVRVFMLSKNNAATYRLTKNYAEKYNHINELDKANIKSQNDRCSIYLIKFDLYWEAFESVPETIQIWFFSLIDNAMVCIAVMTLRNAISLKKSLTFF